MQYERVRSTHGTSRARRSPPPVAAPVASCSSVVADAPSHIPRPARSPRRPRSSTTARVEGHIESQKIQRSAAAASARHPSSRRRLSAQCIGKDEPAAQMSGEPRRRRTPHPSLLCSSDTPPVCLSWPPCHVLRPSPPAPRLRHVARAVPPTRNYEPSRGISEEKGSRRDTESRPPERVEGTTRAQKPHRIAVGTSSCLEEGMYCGKRVS
jgi:hypothetical protein